MDSRIRYSKRRAPGDDDEEVVCSRFGECQQESAGKTRDRDTSGPQAMSVGAIKSTGLFNNEQPHQSGYTNEECLG
eukprot:gnl/Chilomastix_caulleri/2189.p1 GENE.gnl/Chilomastix_caulleri/2189~~gnl/Chilomastix_caulleri/2189.p1  ORF type:complete len:76 (+),score=16.61 gnl/Chilomastix_caulleri/2189:136-363(+)